jgi:hypothetical protein
MWGAGMTCKDCIGYEYCNPQPKNPRQVEKWCKKFKNKADFVEIVRCAKCKYGEVGIFSKAKGGEDIACYCTLKKVVTNTDSYCPSGRRKKIILRSEQDD